MKKKMVKNNCNKSDCNNWGLWLLLIIVLFSNIAYTFTVYQGLKTVNMRANRCLEALRTNNQKELRVFMHNGSINIFKSANMEVK